MPKNPAEVNVIDVKNFLSHKSTPVILKDMQEFWKSLSDGDKDDIKRSVSNWDGQSYYC